MDDFKGIGGLRLAEVPDPVPQPDEVILQVHYAALNPADRYLAENSIPPNPGCPISSGAMAWGRWSQVGSGVETFASEIGEQFCAAKSA